MDQFFLRLYYQIKKQKTFSLGILSILMILLVCLATQLKLEEDITQLIPASEQANLTNKVLQQVNFADKIILYIETNEKGNADDLTQYASQFLDSLNLRCGAYVKDIQGKVDDDAISETLDFVYENLPLFLTQNDYEKIAAQLSKDRIDERTLANYKTLISPTGIIARKMILKDPLGLSFLGLEKLQQLNIGDNFELYNSFLISKDHRRLLLFITPQLAANETAENDIFVEKLYEISEQLNSQFATKVKGEYYGTTMVAVANARQIKWDIQLTISIAMSILLLILIFFYRKLSIPLILFVPTIIGGLFGISILYLIKTKTSAISLGIGSVLLGITLDYSLHILTHYRNNPNIQQLYKDVTRPILMSSLTTAFAFLCLLFLSSEALRDLGIFAAASVLGAAFSALIFIPQVYQRSTKNSKIASTFIDRIAAINFDKNKGLILGLVGLFIMSYFTFDTVFFNQDLSKMNFQTAALKKTEKKLDELINHASKSVYVVAYGDSVEEALEYNNNIAQQLAQKKEKGAILSYNSIGSIVLSQKDQEKKIKDWNQFWEGSRKTAVLNNLIESGNKLGFKPTSFQQFYNLLAKDFTTLSLAEYSKISGLLVKEYISDRNNLFTVAALVKVPYEKTANFVDSFKDIPQTVIIDRKHINETFLGSLKNDFNRLIRYSFAAVFLLLLLFFKRIELALITILPILLTWLLTIGIMGIAKLEFNIFNIIISTFIFGLGVDYSIFMTNGLIKKYKYGEDTLSTYRTAIILSVITTILGVGALVFAQHPALKSIALISLIGILSAVLISFIIQPLLFRFVISGRVQKGYAPLRLISSIHSFILFAYYGLGGMLLSVFSVTFLPLIPISKKKKMKWLHKFMARMVTTVLYGNPFVKKEIINPHKEDFDKPAIIISNHSSALDTLTLGMMTHKLIYLVNDWVYKSPIFGLLARVAGFYPVSSGVDNSHEPLKEKIRQGYSLVVFPEGKRAKTNKIGRFHKGAFFLSETLGLDILPIYLHGNSEVLPKGDRVIYGGSLTAKIGQRIALDDVSFGKTYKERQKRITKFYKSEFQTLRDTIEQAEYFKGILLSNYIYKGTTFYQQIKKDFQANKQLYQAISAYIPFKSKVLHIADDFGQIDILLVARSLDRQITTLILDEEKRQIAANCYTNQTRKVAYPNNISDYWKGEKSWESLTCGPIDVLLISAQLAKLPMGLLANENLIKKAVLIDNGLLQKELEQAGFVVFKQEGNLIILNR